MKAMILAAGLGTRLRPVTNKIPKPIIPIENRPLIEYLLLFLNRNGIKEIIINLHHLGEKIEKSLGDGSRWGMEISYSKEDIILGTGGGIKRVQAFFDSTFLVINGDILIDLDLHGLIGFHQKKGGIATMVLRKNDNPDLYGPVKIDQDARIRQLLDRPGWLGGDLNSYMFTGIHIIEPEIFKYIPDDQYCSIIDTYIDMINRGERLYGYIMKGFWVEISTIERYRKIRKDYKEGLIRLSYI